jgi:hypothetical protein
MTDIKKTILIVGEVAAEQIEAWRKQHKEVYTIEVDDDDCTHVGYLRKPDIGVLSKMSRLSVVVTAEGDVQQNAVEAGIYMIDACWLGGDTAIRTDDDLLFAAAQTANMLYKAKTARIKKN